MKKVKLFNTLTRKKEVFVPIEEGRVRFYQCGPTVYSAQHIGNLFSAVKGDLVRRTLMYLGYEVAYTRNITDVGHLTSDGDEGEDKIEKGSKKEGLTPGEITRKYAAQYNDSIEKLNVLAPTYETWATKYVEEMADMVQVLLDKGFAYVTEKAIYFDVFKFPEYTKLNKQNLEKMKSGFGHGSEGDEQKHSPYDFALWFFKVGSHKNALQFWNKTFEGVEQPAEEGFPGWHIECSAMAKATLGDTIDLHMGGVEHIPVHHTNEIAQSECANGVKFTNYWLHHELLSIDGGKMSKSLDNVYVLDDLIEKGFEPLDYRYWLLLAHYRSKQNFTWDAMAAARSARTKLESIIRNLRKDSIGKNLGVDEEWKTRFMEALVEDVNVPAALAVMWDMLKSDLAVELKLGTILDFDKVFGLDLKAVAEFSGYVEEFDVERLVINKLIQKRTTAKEEKDFELADKIRVDLLEKGVILEDSAEGTTWKYK